MKFNLILASALILSTLTVARGADTAGVPSVDSILAKYVAACGGKEALEKTTSRAMKFKFESDATGSSEGEILSKAPNKQWSKIDLTGVGMMNEGFDGAVAWAKSPWEGLRVKSGEELAKVKRDSDFHRNLKLKSLYPGLAYKGKEKAGDEEAYLLESKPTASSKESFLFGAKTGLLLRQESQFEGPQGIVKVTMLAQDYKAFDGLKYPGQLKLKISAGGQNFDFTMKVLEVKHNVKIEDAKFAKPSA